jgi:hypothetical protein
MLKIVGGSSELFCAGEEIPFKYHENSAIILLKTNFGFNNLNFSNTSHRNKTFVVDIFSIYCILFF